MLIRDAVESEFDEIGELTVRAYANLPNLELRDDYRGVLMNVARRAQSNRVLVAEDEGVLVGTVTFVSDPTSEEAEFDDPDAAGIRMLAVDVAYQGRGIGRALTEACVMAARTAGRQRVILFTLDAMVVAQSLYRSLGFVRDTRRDWEPVPDVSLIGYAIELAD
ncbi:MAG: GNAT family N-acetyltransferase [Actinobacteria bacterium]|nr:GNAT family N-acetyltransferase [Actinomycetota bacterium]